MSRSSILLLTILGIVAVVALVLNASRTERPGNPVIEVNTDWLPDTKLARVVVKQTQPGEPFVFPLALAFAGKAGSQPVDRSKKKRALAVDRLASATAFGLVCPKGRGRPDGCGVGV